MLKLIPCVTGDGETSASCVDSRPEYLWYREVQHDSTELQLNGGRSDNEDHQVRLADWPICHSCFLTVWKGRLLYDCLLFAVRGLGYMW